MKLYQNPLSPPCRRVLATMYHLGSPVELMTVDFRSGQLESPEFRKMNPNGALPTLADGDFYLAESCAIMQYLCEKKGSTDLYPSDARTRAAINQWSYWTAYHFAPACGTLVWENMLKPMFGAGETDAAEVKQATEDFHKYAKVLEQQLAGKDFVIGKTLTLADFTVGSTLMYAEGGRIPMDAYPNIKAWYKRLENNDAWKKSAPPKM